MCEDKLCEYIDVGNSATILTLAEQHHCHGLKKACFSFLSNLANLRVAMASDGFKHLSRSCPAIEKDLMSMLES
jgi:speckle-type POZ protein